MTTPNCDSKNCGIPLIAPTTSTKISLLVVVSTDKPLRTASAIARLYSSKGTHSLPVVVYAQPSCQNFKTRLSHLILLMVVAKNLLVNTRHIFYHKFTLLTLIMIISFKIQIVWLVIFGPSDLNKIPSWLMMLLLIFLKALNLPLYTSSS